MNATVLSSPFLWSCSLCYAMCSVDEILVSVSIQMKAILSCTFSWYGNMLYKGVLPLES